MLLYICKDTILRERFPCMFSQGGTNLAQEDHNVCCIYTYKFSCIVLLSHRVKSRLSLEILCIFVFGVLYTKYRKLNYVLRITAYSILYKHIALVNTICVFIESFYPQPRKGIVILLFLKIDLWENLEHQIAHSWIGLCSKHAFYKYHYTVTVGFSLL